MTLFREGEQRIWNQMSKLARGFHQHLLPRMYLHGLNSIMKAMSDTAFACLRTEHKVYQNRM